MTDTTYSDLVTRVAALERLTSNPFSLDLMPLADLRRSLIDNGPPLDLSVLALTNNVADFGSLGPIKIRVGTGTLSFVANNDASTSVAHGLGVEPTVVLAAVNGASGSAAQAVGYGADATDVTVYSRFLAGNTTADYEFSWLAALIGEA